MPRTHSRHDLAGHLLAVLLILAGIGMLVIVFITASHLFSAPVPGLGLPLRADAPPPPAASIGIALALLLRQIAFLILMIVAGSLIATKGIHLYYWASNHHVENAPNPVDPKVTEPVKAKEA